MKTITTLLLTMAVATMLFSSCCGRGSCDAPTTSAQADQATEQTAKLLLADLVGTYHGIIPAADRAGFDVTITIHEDGTAQFTDKTVDEDKVINDFVGKIGISSNSPQITIRSGDDTYHFNVVDGNLLMVSPDGAEPELRDAYILKRQ